MKRLDLGRCRWVDDNSLLALSAMHHMEELDLSMAEQVTSKGLEVVGHWPSMSRLTLANACKVRIHAMGREYVPATSPVGCACGEISPAAGS